jgi:hypothetical protein
MKLLLWNSNIFLVHVLTGGLFLSSRKLYRNSHERELGYWLYGLVGSDHLFVRFVVAFKILAILQR